MLRRPRIEGLPACHGATPEIAPARVRALAALAGLPVGPLRRVLVLECGTGDGVALLAAATAGTGVEVIGATADPEEAAAARALIAAAGLEARVIEGAPGTLLAHAALPELDLVALPAGWDRLDAAARAGVAALLAARLAPGGAFLLRREVLPGAMSYQSVRRLLGHCLASAEEAGAAAPVAAALELAERHLRQCHTLVRFVPEWAEMLVFLAALPEAVARREWMDPQGPVWSAREVAAALAPAGLTLRAEGDFAAAAPGLDRSPEQRALIAAAATPAAAAEAEALLLARRWTREIWLRPGGRVAAAGEIAFARTARAWAPPVQAPGLSERLTLDEAAHAPVLEAVEAVAADGGAARLAEIAARAALPEGEAAERVAALVAAGMLAPAGEAAAGPTATAAARRLNLLLLEAGTPEALAAPRLGGAVAAAGPPEAFVPLGALAHEDVSMLQVRNALGAGAASR